MAVLNICGFETGDTSELGDVVGNPAPSIQTTTKRNGSYALRVNPSTTNFASARILGATASSWTGLGSGFNAPTCYYRFAFLYLVKPTSNNEIFVMVESKMEIRLNSNAGLDVYDKDSSLVASTSDNLLASGVWYEISFKCGTGASAAYEVWVDRTVVLSGTANLSTTNNSSIYFGKHINKNSNSVDFYYDDIAIDDAAYPPPNGRVLALNPNADGNATSWTAGAAGNSGDYQDVDDLASQVGHDSDTTYVKSSTQNDAELNKVVTVSTRGLGMGTVNAMKAMVVFRKAVSQALSMAARFVSGSTTSSSDTEDPGQTYVYRFRVFGTDPNTSAAWTAGAANAAQIGVVHLQSQSRQANCTLMAIMVDFSPGYLFRKPAVLNQSIMRAALR